MRILFVKGKSGSGMSPFSPILCLALCTNNQAVVSGSVDGRLTNWNGHVASKSISAHNGKAIGGIIA